jgi:hypothetical protein
VSDFRAVLSGEATVTPKSGDGPVEAVRQLRVARNGAMKSRTAAANQVHSLIDTAPDNIRERLIGLTLRKKIGDRTVAARHHPHARSCGQARAGQRRASLGGLDLATRELDRHLHTILRSIAAPLLARHGVGYETAGQLLVTAGDNPDRIHSESELRRIVRQLARQRVIRQDQTPSPQPRR